MERPSGQGRTRARLRRISFDDKGLRGEVRGSPT
jgi:hypothetical protein